MFARKRLRQLEAEHQALRESAEVGIARMQDRYSRSIAEYEARAAQAISEYEDRIEEADQRIVRVENLVEHQVGDGLRRVERIEKAIRALFGLELQRSGLRVGP